MPRSAPQPHPDDWGSDPLSAEIDDQISHMPDRPAIVLALCNHSDECDTAIIESLSGIKGAYLTFTPLKIFWQATRVYYLGFDRDSRETAFDVLHRLAAMPYSEGAIYLDGKAVLRLSRPRLQKRPPSGYIDDEELSIDDDQAEPLNERDL